MLWLQLALVACISVQPAGGQNAGHEQSLDAVRKEALQNPQSFRLL